MALDARFWSKIVMGENPDDCWRWTGATTAFGYGVISAGYKQGNLRAHRLSWVLHNGPLPEDMFVLHRCDNPPCCNPRHLFVGAKRDNTRDMLAKDREARGEQHGHARLASTEAAAIARMIREGSSASVAGAIYGVSRSHASAIAAGAKWRKTLCL